MRTIAIKMKNYGAGINIVNNNNIERRIFHTLILCLGLLAFLYILFLGNMVKDIVERRSLEINVRALSNEVGNLELTYLSMSNNVDLAFSYSMGFKETRAIFATRKSLSSISLKNISVPFDSIKVAQNDI